MEMVLGRCGHRPLRGGTHCVGRGTGVFWDDVGIVPYGAGRTAFVGVGADAHISPGILNTKCYADRHHFTVIQRLNRFSPFSQLRSKESLRGRVLHWASLTQDDMRWTIIRQTNLDAAAAIFHKKKRLWITPQALIVYWEQMITPAR